MIRTNAIYIPESREEREMRFSAEMTQHQFEALECKMAQSSIISQLRTLGYIDEIRMSATCEITEVERWLINSWNTERLLRITKDSFTGNSLSFAIQWAFPQLYYSAFSSILAYFRVVGFTQRSHSGVIKKCGALINEGKYPTAISFRATGGKNDITFNDIAETPGQESIRFLRSDPDSVNNQICQFLRSTRKIDLDNKKPDVRIKRKNGRGNKKSFNQSDWEFVSSKLGYTNLLNLLYRKRIKSNYRDIDTFLSEHLDAPILFNSIIGIINSINLVHESFIAKCISKARFIQVVEGVNFEFVNSRYEIIDMIIS